MALFSLFPHTNRELIAPAKLGRVPGGPIPAQLPFIKHIYNLSQVAVGAQPMLPFLINSVTLSVKGKSILSRVRSFPCHREATASPLQMFSFLSQTMNLVSLLPLPSLYWPLSPVLPQPATLGPHLEAQTATSLEPCFPLSWLSWEEGFGLGGRVYLFLAYVTSSQLPTGYGTWLSFPSRLHDRAHNSSEGQGGAQEEEETLWKEE